MKISSIIIFLISLSTSQSNAQATKLIERDFAVFNFKYTEFTKLTDIKDICSVSLVVQDSGKYLIYLKKDSEPLALKSDTALPNWNLRTVLDTTLFIHYYLQNNLTNKSKVHASVPYGHSYKRVKYRYYHCNFSLFDTIWSSSLTTSDGVITQLGLHKDNPTHRLSNYSAMNVRRKGANNSGVGIIKFVTKTNDSIIIHSNEISYMDSVYSYIELIPASAAKITALKTGTYKAFLKNIDGHWDSIAVVDARSEERRDEISYLKTYKDQLLLKSSASIDFDGEMWKKTFVKYKISLKHDLNSTMVNNDTVMQIISKKQDTIFVFVKDIFGLDTAKNLFELSNSISKRIQKLKVEEIESMNIYSEDKWNKMDIVNWRDCCFSSSLAFIYYYKYYGTIFYDGNKVYAKGVLLRNMAVRYHLIGDL